MSDVKFVLVIKRTCRDNCRLKAAGTAALAVFCLVLAEGANSTNEEDFFFMDINDLLKVDITSVSKSPRKITHTPAAIYILTSEDIRRSGATSLPELFRIVPGMNVARSNSGRWQVSVRGFHRSFSTKLLVLIDGRTVYNPLMAGVYWDVQDVILEDIDRIEIIRGPGASLWGANAVNGVINIMTKTPKDTQGGQIVVMAGDEDKLITSGRFGGEAGNAYYRIYAQHYDRDATWISEDEPIDDSDMVHSGFRIDWDVSPRDALTFQGEVYEGNNGGYNIRPLLVPPYSLIEINDVETEGMFFMGRYSRDTQGGGLFNFHVYYDTTERSARAQFSEERDTFDVDIQHTIRRPRGHTLMWGAEYRHTADETVGRGAFEFVPADRRDDLYSFFAQDDISLMDERLHIIAGAKYEHNDYTGSEFQPSCRLLYNVNEKYSVWTAVSSAVRTPSRFDSDVRLELTTIPGSVPTLVKFYGNDDVEPESMIAYEAGFRAQPCHDMLLDVTAFVNDYDHLYTSASGRPASRTLPVAHNEIPLVREATNKGEVRGLELLADWWPLPTWRLTASYTILDMDVDRQRNNEENPDSQASIRSFLNLPNNMEFDVAGYYVAGVPWHDIDSYYRLDARLGWHCSENVEISLVGQNLAEDHHAEFLPDGTPYQAEVERSFYGKVTLVF